jgi:hypothetical protein
VGECKKVAAQARQAAQGVALPADRSAQSCLVLGAQVVMPDVRGVAEDQVRLAGGARGGRRREVLDADVEPAAAPQARRGPNEGY